MHLSKPTACTRAAALQGYCLIHSSHCAKSRFIQTERHNANADSVTWPVQLQGCDGEAHNSYRPVNWTCRSVLTFCARLVTYFRNRSIMRIHNRKPYVATRDNTLDIQNHTTDFCENWFWVVQITNYRPNLISGSMEHPNDRRQTAYLLTALT